MSKISFVTFISTEEIADIRNSIYCLLNAYEQGDEIIIVIDDEHYNQQADSFLNKIQFEFESYDINILHHSLNNDFAVHRNFAIDNSNGDYIFMLDADETINYHYLRELHNVTDDIRVMAFPRINEVIGFTAEDYRRHNFNVNQLGWVNYPDYQTRFFKNCGIRYIDDYKVHERLNENATIGSFANIHHIKTAKRQEKQNAFYGEIINENLM